MRTSEIVFFGSPAFAVRSLEAILESGRKVPLVVTQTDKPAGRGRRLAACALKNFAEARGIPVLQPERLKDAEFQERVRAVGARVFVVAAYGRILPEALLAIPQLTLNVHASLLPRWRGASPIQHAILHGDTKTGVSVMRLVRELDAGDVLLAAETGIGAEETAGELEARLAAMGGKALIEALDRIEGDDASFVPQDASRVTLAPPISSNEGKIDWSQNCANVHRKIMAFNPHPGAFALRNEERIKIHRSRLSPFAVRLRKPGELAVEKGKLWVSCRDAWLEILELQREGKKPQSAANFLSGYRGIDTARWS
ncbi:MAG: methionyl-tRNA formyltransferase [Pseudomonadota bacterium]